MRDVRRRARRPWTGLTQHRKSAVRQPEAPREIVRTRRYTHSRIVIEYRSGLNSSARFLQLRAKIRSPFFEGMLSGHSRQGHQRLFIDEERGARSMDIRDPFMRFRTLPIVSDDDRRNP